MTTRKRREGTASRSVSRRTSDWSAARRLRLVMEILERRTSIRSAARTHALSEAEIQRWRRQFLQGGARALRSKRRPTGTRGVSAARLQSIVDNTTAVIYVKDTEGRYEIINRQFERIFHVARANLLGLTDYDFLPRSTADAVRENDRKVFEAGKAMEFEEIVPHDDGPHSYISIKFPLFDTRDKPNAVCGISTDITERKRANERLQELTSELEAFYQAQPDLCFQLAPDGTILEYKSGPNAALFVPPEQFLRKRMQDVLPEETAARLAEAIARVGESESEVATVEYVLPMPDGRRHYEARVTPLGNRERILVLIRDITTRKQAEESLELLSRRLVTVREEEQQRMGLDLHDGVCQELVGVGIMLGAARERVAATMPETAERLTRAGECLAEVADHLRLMARDLRPMLLHDLGLRESLRALAGGLSTSERRVATQLPDRMPSLEDASEAGVYRIAQEALTNATRHAQARLTTLTLASDGGTVRLVVRDDGKGFDLNAVRGRALGITGMEQRAIALGGRLRIESAPARGTTVVFEYPLRIEERGREASLRRRTVERKVRPR